MVVVVCIAWGVLLLLVLSSFCRLLHLCLHLSLGLLLLGLGIPADAPSVPRVPGTGSQSQPGLQRMHPYVGKGVRGGDFQGPLRPP